MKVTRNDQALAPSQTTHAPVAKQTGGAKPAQQPVDAFVDARPGSEGQVTMPPAVDKKPPSKKTHKLTKAELKSVAGIGGRGLHGTGTLEGEIKLVRGKAYLITAAKGSKSEVAFVLDLPRDVAAGLKGQHVAVHGTIDKSSPWGGTIKGASLVDDVAGVFPQGTYQTLTGTIAQRHLYGPGGEAPPSGAWLTLDKPIKVGDMTVNELFVGEELPNGTHATLSGRLDVKTYGGVEIHPARPYVALTGVSNVGAGEPRFDGQHFFNADGAQLKQINVFRRDVMDAPNTILVLDPAADKAFVGSMGGMMPPGMNPFHGFRGAAAIEEPTATERKSVRFDAEGNPTRNGKKLELVGSSEPPPGTADMFSHAWYYDSASKTVFGFVSGGIAGFVNRMDAVMKMP